MRRERKKNLAPLFIFLIILLPLIIVGVLYLGSPTFKKLPVYGNKIANAPGDTTFHKVSPFTLINSEGDSFSRSQLDGKVYVANFIFTRCPGICPTLTKSMKDVQEEFERVKNLAFVSFSVDPKHDSPPVLAKFKKKHNIEANNWHFLTGEKEKIYLIGNKDYLIALAEGDTTSTNLEERFLHTEFLVLVDKEQRVRGFYNGTSSEEVKRLKEEIRVLFKEYEDK